MVAMPVVSMPTVVSAVQTLIKQSSIPLREPSTARPTFWSTCLAQTKTRPIPANSGWIDLNQLIPGVGTFPEHYAAIVNYFIATSQASMATSGLLYRFLLEGDLLPNVNLAAGVDYNVERINTVNPFPAQPRKIFINVTSSQHLSLQVKNTSGTIQNAYTGLFGWFYPDLGSTGAEAYEGSGFQREDTVRDLQGPYGPSY
jgi:hypothetical protein